MTHRRARRLMPELLDGSLDRDTCRAVRAHARGCSDCRARLREHEAAEALLRLLPPSLVPCDPTRDAQTRLFGLARWFVDPVANWRRERMNLGALGMGMAVAAYIASATLPAWIPVSQDSGSLIKLAEAAPDASFMLPLGWR